MHGKGRFSYHKPPETVIFMQTVNAVKKTLTRGGFCAIMKDVFSGEEEQKCFVF